MKSYSCIKCTSQIEASTSLHETEDILLYQSNLVRVELFSHVDTFIGFSLLILGLEIYASEVRSTHLKSSVGFG